MAIAASELRTASLVFLADFASLSMPSGPLTVTVITSFVGRLIVLVRGRDRGEDD